MGPTNSDLSQPEDGTDSRIDNGGEVMSDNVPSEGDKLLCRLGTIGTALASSICPKERRKLGRVL